VKKQYDFRKGKRGAVLPAVAGKTRITIRIDNDVLAWFREQVHMAGGGNYQTLINRALREQVTRQREPLEATVRRVLKEELAEATEGGVRRGRAYEQAYRRWIRDMKNPRSLGTKGKITWTRDELHERHPEKKTK
jgi:BrnA antitoxin of type II toxin-antitoxin system